MSVNLFIYECHLLLRPQEGCKVLWRVMSVTLSLRITRKPHGWILSNFLLTLPSAVARSCSGGVVIGYVFPVLWMTSYFHVHGRMMHHVYFHVTTEYDKRNRQILFSNKDQQVYWSWVVHQGWSLLSTVALSSCLLSVNIGVPVLQSNPPCDKLYVNGTLCSQFSTNHISWLDITQQLLLFWLTGWQRWQWTARRWHAPHQSQCCCLLLLFNSSRLTFRTKKILIIIPSELVNFVFLNHGCFACWFENEVL